MTHALYNEIEPFAADWLEQLIDRGHIAPGRVERRSITELAPADVAGPGQRHFFAGIGGWSYALRLAGVPDDADIWTGSCPCQPFSQAGRRGGTSDPRHLWPAWFALIRECRPAIIFGEQVAGPGGLAWLDGVFADLEGCGYACGASVVSAAGVGAPHIRHRIYFVAQSRLGHPDGLTSRRHGRAVPGPQATSSLRRSDYRSGSSGEDVDWPAVRWLDCLDGKRRPIPVEPALFPLASGVPNRVGLLRGSGNAIVPQAAAVFIRAALEAREALR